MKSKFIFSFLVLTLLFTSCLIKSFNPFYQVQDVVFKDQLVGKWQDQDDSSWEFVKPVIKENQKGEKEIHPHYILNYSEEEGSSSRFMATLFKLEGQFYLDFFPDLETISDHELLAIHTLPVHSLAKVEFKGEDDVQINWFNEGWVAEMIEKQKSKIDHQLIKYDSDEGTLVLTASTPELQKFIKEFGNDPEAFDCEDQFSGDAFCKKLKKI